MIDLYSEFEPLKLFILERENQNPLLFLDLFNARKQRDFYESQGQFASIRPLNQIDVKNPLITDYMSKQGFSVIDGYYLIDRLSDQVYCLVMNRIDGKIDLDNGFYYFSLYRFDNSELHLVNDLICHEAIKSLSGFYFIHDGLKIPLRQFKRHFVKISKR